MIDKYIKASECEKYFYEHLDDNGIIGAMNAIDEMPAADVQPVKFGKWVYYYSKNEYDIYKCSVCNKPFELPMNVIPSSVFCYCPRCSADMRNKEDRYIEKLEKELKQAKELLQAAVNFITDGDCPDCAYNVSEKCPVIIADDVCKFKWIYKDEALALIESGST